jgi:hypothetical protein
MRKLAGTTWGANKKILKTIYQGTVRPAMEYSSSTWATTAKTNQHTLDKVQNQALCIITGATKSTPIAFMKKCHRYTAPTEKKEGQDSPSGREVQVYP